MPATARLNELAERKRALTAQADLYREAIGAERQLVEQRCLALRKQAAMNGWWWVGAAAVAGWLLPRPIGSLLAALPAFLAINRNPPRAGNGAPAESTSAPG